MCRLDKQPRHFSMVPFHGGLMDESGPDLAAFKELHSVNDLALCTTKNKAQPISRSMPA